MKLKVCGMRETKNITALANLQPDYMGFIFWETSKRYCATIPSDIPKAIKKVGVFVDETTEQIKAKPKSGKSTLILSPHKSNNDERLACCKWSRLQSVSIGKGFEECKNSVSSG